MQLLHFETWGFPILHNNTNSVRWITTHIFIKYREPWHTLEFHLWCRGFWKIYDDVITRKRILHHWSLWEESISHWINRTNGQQRWVFMVLLLAFTSCWIHGLATDHWRRYDAHVASLYCVWWLKSSKCKSRGFETSWDLTARRLIAWRLDTKVITIVRVVLER